MFYQKTQGSFQKFEKHQFHVFSDVKMIFCSAERIIGLLLNLRMWEVFVTTLTESQIDANGFDI